MGDFGKWIGIMLPPKAKKKKITDNSIILHCSKHAWIFFNTLLITISDVFTRGYGG